MHSNYCLLMAEILRVWKQEGFQIKKREKETVLSEKFTEVSEYISQHYQEDLSVAELAEKFHMSYSYFAAIFKEYYGQTCKEMVLTVRLQKAEDLLQFTDFDLTYISQETGFCDCSHFIKAFKQKYGVTPRKYRMCHIYIQNKKGCNSEVTESLKSNSLSYYISLLEFDHRHTECD